MKTSSLTSALKALLVRDDINRIPKVDILFISPDAAKSERYQGKYFERVLGPFMLAIENSKFNFGNIARPLANITGNKTWLYSYSLNRAVFVASIFDKMQSLVGNERHYVKDLWKTIFLKAEVKAILVHGVTGNICSAARELDIPVVEVLHGKGYRSAYQGWWEHAPLEELPTHVFSFDSVSTSSFSAFGRGKFSVIQLDDPWNDELIEKVTSSNDTLGKFSPATEELPRILFTLTWGYAGDHEPGEKYFQGIVPNGLIPDEVFEVMKKTIGMYNWKFRLHPKQLTEIKYSKIRKRLGKLLKPFPNAEWDSSTSVPLGKEMRHASYHLSLSSMSSYEAASRAVPTLILDPNFRPGEVFSDMFQDLKDAKMLTVASHGTAEEILEWLKTNSNQKIHTDSLIVDKEQLLVEVSKLLNDRK